MNEYFCSISAAELAIRNYESRSKTKFVVRNAPKGFGTRDDLQSKNHYIVFEDKSCVPKLHFDGIPFMILGRKTLHCHRGKNYNRKMEKSLETDQDLKRQKLQLQNTKKIGCPARIVMREVFIFPSHKVTSLSEWKRKCASQALRNSIKKGEVAGERRIVVSFPQDGDHNSYCMSEVAGLVLPVDRRIIQYIQDVVRTGVRTVSEMERHLKQFVSHHLFPGEELPPWPNRRFFPSKTDIKNAMQREIAKGSGGSSAFTGRSISAAELAIRNYESRSNTRFIVRNSPKGFGTSEDLQSKSHYIVFEDKSCVPKLHFDGIPFMILGRKTLHCHRGKFYNRKTEKSSETDKDFKRQKLQLQNTKKIGCPARIVMRDIFIFPSHKVTSLSEWKRKCASQALRNSIKKGEVAGERRIVVSFPQDGDHSSYCTSESAVEEYPSLIGGKSSNEENYRKVECQHS